MVSDSKPSAYTPPEAVSTSGSTINSHDEPPIIRISENDIRIVLDKDDHHDRTKPPHERNAYNLQKDPSLRGKRRPTNLPFCPHCSKENVRTRTKTYPNSVTWGCAAVGAVIFLPLALIPLMSDGMKKTDHYCQNCNQKLATIKPFDGVGVKERM